MTQIKESIFIEAPVDKVFSYISDFQNWPEFYEGISDVEPITEKTRKSGSRFIYKISSAGMSFKVGTELRDFKENEGWTGKSFKGVDSETFWKVNDKNGKTEFTHGIVYHLPWFMGGKLLDNLFLKSAFFNTVKVSLKNVKRIMEENDAPQ